MMAFCSQYMHRIWVNTADVNTIITTQLQTTLKVQATSNSSGEFLTCRQREKCPQNGADVRL